MENRHGLVVDAELTRASGHAERLAALAMLDRLGEDLGTLDRDIGVAVVDQPAVRRLLTITSMHVTVAAGWSPRSAISAVSPARRSWSATGLNPRVRPSWLGLAQHGRISKIGRALLVEAAWAAANAPGPLHAFFLRSHARRGHQVAAVATATQGR